MLVSVWAQESLLLIDILRLEVRIQLLKTEKILVWLFLGLT